MDPVRGLCANTTGLTWPYFCQYQLRILFVGVVYIYQALMSMKCKWLHSYNQTTITIFCTISYSQQQQNFNIVKTNYFYILTSSATLAKYLDNHADKVSISNKNTIILFKYYKINSGKLKIILTGFSLGISVLTSGNWKEKQSFQNK